ncbi:MAG TPA: ribonuclease HI family protein [Chthonomonadales bacterium]|nr:ribonuclease HI family protein [Chthonomonadales bacterium]
MTELIAHVDGAARGNPGPAGIGVVLIDSQGNVVKEIAEGLGITTNNVAEYSALIRALEEARALGCTHIAIFTDSELMERQINGRYRVRTPHLLPLFTRATQLLAQFEKATVTHTHRHNNSRADMLSHLGADKSEGKRVL